MTNSDLTLVPGGTGRTGRRVAARLTALGRPLRVLDGRNAEPAGGVTGVLGRAPRDFAATAWGAR